MPRNNDIESPLLSLLRECDADERAWLADEAQTTVNYLYHLALGKRSPTIVLAKRLIEACARLRVRTNRRTPALTLEQLASLSEDR